MAFAACGRHASFSYCSLKLCLHFCRGPQVVDVFIGGQDEAESSSESDSSEDERAVPRYWGRARGLSAGMASPHYAF